MFNSCLFVRFLSSLTEHEYLNKEEVKDNGEAS